MKTISKRIKIIGLISIMLWIFGSTLLFDEKNGTATIVISDVIIMAGLYSQIVKERKVDSSNWFKSKVWP